MTAVIRSAWEWLGHYGMRVAVVAAIFCTAVFMWAPGWLIFVIALSMAVATTAAELHGVTVCDACFDRGMAADPEVQAARHRWAMRMRHFVHDHPIVSWAIAIAVSGAAALTAAHTRGLLEWVLRAGVFAPMLVGAHNRVMHGRFQQWCPWCRDDGDDEDVEVPDPVDHSVVR